MSIPKDDWQCLYGPYHIFDPEDISICFCCSIVHFYCSNCEKEIATMALEECPKESRNLIFQLTSAMQEEGDGRQPA
ncbi:MAG: hypothetical protein E3J81_09005 [Dehalococcoidia bacterium]|nr:MAG: hypothetical protein E3J81_09005 [Dehalococcoidia bacterium]